MIESEARKGSVEAHSARVWSCVRAAALATNVPKQLETVLFN